MSPPFALPLDWLRSISNAFLPDTCSIQRYTEQNTPDGVVQDWLTVATGIACRVSPLASSGVEGVGPSDNVTRAISQWVVWTPANTDATERDRVTIDAPDGRTFEINRAGQRSYETVRELVCTLIS